MNAKHLALCLACSMHAINVSCYHYVHHLIFNYNGVFLPEHPTVLTALSLKVHEN